MFSCAGRKEELMARDATTSEQAEGLREEVERLSRDQEDILNRDKEV